jgi:hypothetical protein
MNVDDRSEGDDSPPGVPRWVQVMAILLAVVLGLAVLVILLVGGDHGPGRHR